MRARTCGHSTRPPHTHRGRDGRAMQMPSRRCWRCPRLRLCDVAPAPTHGGVGLHGPPRSTAAPPRLSPPSPRATVACRTPARGGPVDPVMPVNGGLVMPPMSLCVARAPQVRAPDRAACAECRCRWTHGRTVRGPGAPWARPRTAVGTRWARGVRVRVATLAVRGVSGLPAPRPARASCARVAGRPRAGVAMLRSMSLIYRR